ncbi:MAG: CoA-binding protein [Chloroflexi bacterium AL-W]|nr:CoA-binding protein [Chloroflexi bacterium AL-N1]NOK69392.1 CoA-binding protein [Chloroflexi bacterium AL-N10]NOK76453.1 CoA-binding protein [Chloroflexi bacterium AL-N5]NOK83570.1 CoA-binding protein [Chloroflexi bacterium AL-W]NOK91230.1 CoA-binding protein [Chloroflexi bacterium AL-N15]
MMPDNELTDILRSARTIAIVGLSDDPNRPSYAVARFLQQKGYQILPVNPKLPGPVLGVQPYASLRDIVEHVDIVDVFRRAEFIPEIVEDAIVIQTNTVWMQLSVVHEEAALQARRAGINVIMDRCIAIEHRRLSRYAEMDLVS